MWDVVIISFVCGIIGILIGWILADHILSRSVGTIKVDHSDPEDGPYLFLEINDQISMIRLLHSKRVTLNVEMKDYISQK